MADTPSRLRSFKSRLHELVEMADSDRKEQSFALAAELSAELDRLTAALPGQPQGDRHRQAPRPPRDAVERCPVCSLRSYHFQKGSIRESDDGGYEAFYRCGSCAHEGWRELPGCRTASGR